MLGPLQSFWLALPREKHGRLSPAGRVSKEVDEDGYPVIRPTRSIASGG